MTEEMTDGGQAQDAPVSDGNNSEEIAGTDGQVSESTQGTEQPAQDSVPSSQYKELQGAYTKGQQRLSELNNAFATYGGPEQAMQALTSLASDPDVRAVLDRKQNGVVEEELDEETQAAKKTVVAWAKQAIKEEMGHSVDPLLTSYRKDRVSGFTAQLDNEFPGWREYEAEMAPIVQEWPESRKLSMDYTDLQGLLMQAVAKKGKIEEFSKSIYERNLQKRKKTATDVPGSARKVTGKATTMAEALSMAKQKMGV
jgi:hypothetical protein